MEVLKRRFAEHDVGSVLLCLTLGLASSLALAEAPPPPATASAPAVGRPRPSPQDLLTSPKVHPDGIFVFCIYAPSAKDVRVQAEGMESTPGITAEETAKMGRRSKSAQAQLKI